MNKLELIFKSFADKNRLRIIKLLERQSLCVCELVYVLGITQPSISRHLKKLKSASIIGSRQEGFWTDYYLDKNNAYVKALLDNLKTWLNDDRIMKEDLRKLKKADRRMLCRK
jgi:ArsR family transcriptional regulator